MHSEVKKIYNFFQQDFLPLETFRVLSYDKANKINWIQNTEKAFDFDKIKNTLYNVSPLPTSVDALFFGNCIAFIEFKNSTDKIKSKCRDKARDSIMIYRFYLQSCNLTGVNQKDIKTKFIVVINSGSFGKPSAAYSAALSKSAGIENSLLRELKNKFTGKNFLKEDTYYTEVDVWNDIDFDRKLLSIK
ncbi:MAG: hypothetical protein FWE22_05400 [Firmicutes bacterium]|nr:hypothetical protein [Bacillota bacterium]